MAKREKVDGFIREFKAFALKGNVVDLAIGVIIGGAFSAITSSLIADIVMPIIGMFLGGIDFSSWSVPLPHLFGGGGDPILLNVGVFLNTVIHFFILAFVVFLMVKAINSARPVTNRRPQNRPRPTRRLSC